MGVFSDEPYCRVCQRRDHAVLVAAGGSICTGCAVLIGRFILTAPDPIIAQFWNAGMREPPTSRRPGVVENPREFQTHLDLGLAYLEMGLRRDTLEQAAAVLAASPPCDIMRQALGIIFDKSMAVKALVHRLGATLFAD